MTRARRWLATAVLLGVGSGVACLAAEGLVRVFAPYSRAHVMPAGMFAADGTLGWKLRPGSGGRHTSPYFTVDYRINAVGFRDIDRPAVKPSGVRRVLLFGDSQVFGWGVPVPERFSTVAEANLPAAEIWNLGVPGYGLDQEVLSYEVNGQAPNVDDVVLFVTQETLLRIQFANNYRKAKPRFAMDSTGALRLQPPHDGGRAAIQLLYRALSGLYLPYFVERQLAAMRERGKRAASTPEPVMGALELGVLRRVLDTARTRGHALTLLSFLPPTARASVDAFASAHGATHVPIVFPDGDYSSLVLGPHDSHWNARGNAMAAAMLGAGLMR